MFIVITFSAALYFWSSKIKIIKLPPFIIVIYLAIILLLCKSLGAVIFGVLIFALLVLVPMRIAKITIKALLISILLYPILSIFNLFPHQDIIEYIFSYSPERAQSLGFRFYHEKILVAHAHEKSFFGWGSWGRNKFHDSVTDGYWIEVYGIRGAVVFFAIFGLIALSAWRAFKALDLVESTAEIKLMLVHILVVSIIIIDQIPNASITGYMWFIVGSLLGRSNYILKKTS